MVRGFLLNQVSEVANIFVLWNFDSECFIEVITENQAVKRE